MKKHLIIYFIICVVILSILGFISTKYDKESYFQTNKITYHKDKDKEVFLNFKNNYSNKVNYILIPQKKINGEWKNLDWFDLNFAFPGEKLKENYSWKYLNKGTYRFKYKIYSVKTNKKVTDGYSNTFNIE